MSKKKGTADFFLKAYNWCDSGPGVEWGDGMAGGRWPLSPNYLTF